jgi:2-methylisocitrate lyase-like PEP mutase family enzyme
MSSQKQLAQQFSALHVRGNPVVLFNAWDPGSARAVAAGGAAAIATGSWSVAAAHGYVDGEHMPLDLAIDNLARMSKTVDLPVTIDLESGYGADPGAVAHTVTRAIQAGAIGCNIEDSVPGTEGLRSVEEQCARIAAVRAAANALDLPFFINARTDIFLQAKPDSHDAAMVAAAIARAVAYAAAGASGFFAPGLANSALIGQLVQGSPLPVNIMVMDSTPSLAEMAALGVARVSHGPRPYRQMMSALEQATRAALQAS